MIATASFFVLTLLAGAESRPHMQRIDASPALYDDGRWLADAA